MRVMALGRLHLWLLTLSGLICGALPLQAQLVLNQTQAPTTLVQSVLMGPGVFASNVTFNGSPGNMVAPVGVGPSEIGRFNGSNTSIGINTGVFLTSGVAAYHLPGPNVSLERTEGGIGAAQGIQTPDLDLSQLTGIPTWQSSGGSNIYSKSVLEFDFVPLKDMITVRYVFSSEEYGRWVCTQYNDVFGFFISGPGIPTNINGPFTNNAMNIALIPGSLSRVSINTVNSGAMDANNANGPWTDPFRPCFDADPNWQANSVYYRDNGTHWPFPQPPPGMPAAQLDAPFNADPYYIAHNGMTVVLTASAAVQCGETYHIKLGLADVGDSFYPSAVFLEGGSFTSTDRFTMTVDPGPTVEYTATDTVFIENDCDSVYLRFHRLGGFYLDEWLQLSVEGTATNGLDVLPAIPDSVHFNQLDSFAIVPIAVPVDLDGLEELIVNILTCNGLNVQTFTYLIDQRPPMVVELEDQDLECPAEVTLTPTVTGGGDDPSEYTYLWSTGETTPSITHMVLETTQFWVTVEDCWATAVTDSAWVTVPEYVPMEITLTPDTAIPCLGHADLVGSAQFGSGGYTYTWTLNGQVQGTDSILNVPAAQPSVYYVFTVTDLCGVEASDSVLVSWAPAPPLVLIAPPDTAIACLGHADLVASVTGGGGTIQYTWTNNGVVMGTDSILNVPAAVNEVYTVEVSDECGQTEQAQIVVTTGPTPPLLISVTGDTVLCAGMQTVLNVVSTSGGGGAYSYSWSPGGTGPSNGPSLNVRVDTDQAYTVTVTDQCGNQADTTVWALVSDFDPLTIEVPNDTTVCPGQVVPLWVVISGGAGNNQTEWPGLGSGPNVSWTADHQGRNILVQVTDACGSTATGSIMVSSFPAGVSIDAQELSEGTWRFEGTTEPPSGNSLEWNFGDGSTATGVLDVTHSYQDYDAHWVVLQIITPDGCIAVDSVRTRPPAATIYFPNSFTPNDDGFNDTFGAEGSLVEEYELLIFDRWGTLIFESHSMDHRWDGRVKGEEPVTGVYPYRYRAKGLSMPMHQGFGHITLLK
ncbi:MAG: choice-of-anchor L domain-containing protein [Flavobacteriales bacterium]|nr:choice-of-anchor L domain-containing protein [Flavobacteriales bacterium]